MKKMMKPRLVGLFRDNVATFSVLWYVVLGNSKNVCFLNILVELFNKWL